MERRRTVRRRRQKRCPFSDKFIVISIAVPVIIFILLGTAVTIYVLYSSTAGKRPCESGDCSDDVYEILSRLDENTNPCDDFYKFACGNFGKSVNEGTFSKAMERKLVDDLNEIVSSPITSDDPVSLTMQKSFYQSCIETGNEESRDRTFYEILHDLGGWPIVNGSAWDEEKFSWPSVLTYCVENGLKNDWFVDIDVYEDEDTKLNTLYIGHSAFDPTKINDQNKEVYKNVIQDIAILMGAPLESASYEMERILQFQTELSAIAQEAFENEQFGIGARQRYRIMDLQNQMPDVLWLQLIKNITKRDFGYEEEIVINSLQYIKELYQLLLRTPKRFQANYIVLQLIDEFWPYLSTPFVDIYDRYHQQTIKSYQPINRTEACLQIAQEKFSGVGDAVYIRNIVDSKTKTDIKELLSNVKYKFANHLKKASWLDSEAKNFGMANMSEILEYIGGPDDIFSENEYDTTLGLVGYSENDVNVIHKILTLNKQQNNPSVFQKVGSPIESKEKLPGLIIQQMEKFDDDEDQTRVVPASFMRYDYYDPRRPKFANYGLLGSLLSFKVTHSFGLRVHSYLKDIKKVQWWTNSLDVNSNIKCYPDDVIEEYYRILTDNGTLRIEKNFADYVANDITYEIYQQWIKQHGSEKIRSDVKYNPNQLFWIFTMQGICASEADEQVYSHYSQRGNKLVKNSYYFANAFKCQPGSSMNPEEKCQIL